MASVFPVSCYVDHGSARATSFLWSGLAWYVLVWSCIVPSALQKIWQTLKPFSHEGVNTSHSACGSHGEQAGSAEADLWPLRKGMWKLFHPGQKLKTRGQLESGSLTLLSTFLMRGSKQRFSVSVLWIICRSSLPFWNEGPFCSSVCYFVITVVMVKCD